MKAGIENVSSLIKRALSRQTLALQTLALQTLSRQTLSRQNAAPATDDATHPNAAQNATSNKLFQFFDPGVLVDGDLRLVVVQKRYATLNGSPQYIFHMTRAHDGARMGSITLRIGDTEFLTMYAGQIGYGVEPAFRGSHLAARSVQLLLPLARRHGLNPLWITCNPDNWASRRSCEIAGGQMIEIVDLPANCDMYREGERQKCRYRFEL